MEHLTQTWPLQAGRRIWLAAAVGLIAAIGLLSFLDVSIMHLARSLPESVVNVFGWITRLGDSEYVLVPSLVGFALAGLAGVLVKESAKRGFRQLAGICGFVFVGVGLPGLITAIIKRLVGRPRPHLLEQTGAFDFRTLSWVDWTYQSFPSGHATTGFALCFVVAFMFPRSYPWMLGLAVLIAVSRIVVGAHFPTDLVAGAAIGVLGAYAVRNFFAARGWVFRRDADARIVRLPFDGIRALFRQG